MSEYIRFTEKEILTAANTDISELLKSEGATLKREGSWNTWLYGDEKISIKGSFWLNHYDGERGNAIDFVKKFMNKTFPEAVMFLNGEATGNIVLREAPKHERPVFEIPPQDATITKVKNYLMSVRGIYPDVLKAFIDEGLIYQTTNKGYSNCVFVGKDNQGNPRHFHFRGTRGNFKGNQGGSDDRYSFHWKGTNNKIFLFEAPIDMLSYICLHNEGWESNSYVAACGVSSVGLLQRLKENPKLNKVYLCLDNDKRGIEFNNRIAEYLKFNGIDYEILTPSCKDWNEDLITVDEAEESEEEPCNQIM